LKDVEILHAMAGVVTNMKENSERGLGSTRGAQGRAMQSLQRAGFLKPYKYQPLSGEKDEIRLLTVLPGKVDDKVECYLNHFELSAAPPYHALSYTWGSLIDPHELSVDGCGLFVTKNLMDALRRLRDVSSKLMIWIDAVSINQQDNAERSEQVTKMRTIYQSAIEVSIWLGESANDSSEAFALVHDLIHCLQAQGDVGAFIRDSPPSRVDQFRALELLLSRDYWRRAWVIQEVHSATKACIYCGTDSVDCALLLKAQNSIFTEEDDLIALCRANGLNHQLDNAIWSSGVKGLQVNSPDSPVDTPSLLDALHWHYNKLCTYPEDKVYCLVGLTSAHEDSRFVVDYSKGARRVFTDVVQYEVTTTQRLDVICGMLRGPNDLGLPSWVPNWAGAYKNTLLDREGFKAAGTSLAAATFSTDGKTLTARGFCIGTVKTLGQKSGLLSPVGDENISDLLSAFYNWRSLTLPEQGTVPEPWMHEGLCRVMAVGVIFSFFPQLSQEEYLEGHLGFFCRFCKLYRPDLVLDPQLDALAEDNSLWASLEERDGWGRYAISESRRHFYKRRFFLADLELMGLIHEDAVPGDLICILLGCKIPIILRAVDDHYVLVGDAYVDYHYMIGRGMEELAEGKYELQDFVIL
jgi:hypothetical protein